MLSDDGNVISKAAPLRFDPFMKPKLIAPDFEDYPDDELAIEFKDFEIPHTKEGQEWFKAYQAGLGATLAASDNGWVEVYSVRKLTGMEASLDGVTGVLLRRCKKVEVGKAAQLFMDYTTNMKESNEQISEYIDTKDLQKLVGWHRKIKIIKEALRQYDLPLAPDLTMWMVGLGRKVTLLYNGMPKHTLAYIVSYVGIHRDIYRHIPRHLYRQPASLQDSSRSSVSSTTRSRQRD
jgi:hypothetical protein